MPSQHSQFTNTSQESNHTIEGAPQAATVAARAAYPQAAADSGRVIRQTGGVRPGWYICDGAGGTPLLAEETSPPLDNFTATADPGVTNDVDEGYTVGSRWLNTTTGALYFCTDNSDGAAVWEPLNEVVVVDSDATRTLTDADHGKLIRCNFASGITVTVNTGLRSGFRCRFTYSAATGSFAIAGTATVHTPDGFDPSILQWGTAELFQVAPNVYILSGDLEATP